jgi:hypothetical protein
LAIFLFWQGRKFVDTHVSSALGMRLPVVGKFGGEVAAQLIDGQDGLDLTQLTVSP